MKHRTYVVPLKPGPGLERGLAEVLGDEEALCRHLAEGSPQSAEEIRRGRVLSRERRGLCFPGDDVYLDAIRRKAEKALDRSYGQVGTTTRSTTDDETTARVRRVNGA